MLGHVGIALTLLFGIWALIAALAKRNGPGPGLWVATGYAAFALHQEGVSWSEIGLEWPVDWPWWGMPIAVFGAVFGAYLALIPVYRLLVQRLHWPRPDMSRFEKRFKGRPVMLGLALVYNWTSAAFIEELFFRAFLISALALTFGSEPANLAVIVVAQAVLFGLPHLYQGKTGIVQSGIIGLVFGAGFVALGTLWPFIIAHGLIGTIGLTGLYWQANRKAADE
jgi:membrane protease YdiL (CAAX protease family)